MAQEQGRFSPAQILMAAEKAEADGRMDHAVQFYRYIAEQQPATPEADLARHAIDRISTGRSPPTEAIRASGYPTPRSQPTEPHINGYEAAPLSERTGPPTGRYQPVPAPAAAPPRAPAQLPHYQPVGPSAPPMSLGAPQSEVYASPQAAPPSYPPQRPARSDTSYGQARMPVLVRLPTPKRGYRSGRILAMVMTIGGTLAMIIGIALFGVALFAPRELARLGPGIAGLIGIGGSLGALVTGAVLLLFGQLARAVFDGANAMRELVSIERAMVRHNSRPAAGEDE